METPRPPRCSEVKYLALDHDTPLSPLPAAAARGGLLPWCSAWLTFPPSSTAEARRPGSFLSPSWMTWAVSGVQEGGISLTGGGSLAICGSEGDMGGLSPLTPSTQLPVLALLHSPLPCGAGVGHKDWRGLGLCQGKGRRGLGRPGQGQVARPDLP